jgi:hypothetical protein
MNEKLLTKRETYQLLKFSLATLDRHIKAGSIAPCKFSSGKTAKVFFTERELNRFIREGQRRGRRLARERARINA